MDENQTGLFKLVEGLKPVDASALAEFEREMTEEAFRRSSRTWRNAGCSPPRAVIDSLKCRRPTYPSQQTNEAILGPSGAFHRRSGQLPLSPRRHRCRDWGQPAAVLKAVPSPPDGEPYTEPVRNPRG